MLYLKLLGNTTQLSKRISSRFFRGFLGGKIARSDLDGRRGNFDDKKDQKRCRNYFEIIYDGNCAVLP
jgi:hypothetical protein